MNDDIKEQKEIESIIIYLCHWDIERGGFYPINKFWNHLCDVVDVGKMKIAMLRHSY